MRHINPSCHDFLIDSNRKIELRISHEAFTPTGVRIKAIFARAGMNAILNYIGFYFSISRSKTRLRIMLT